jgi:hypothetical protein
MIPAPMTPNDAQTDRQRMRLEQLLTVSKRLIEAISGDIAALERGAIAELKTTDPEIERLCAFYGREVRSLKAEGGIKGVPKNLIAALRETGKQLDTLLVQHAHLLAAMREASEGLVQAVAEGVERARCGAKPYSQPQQKPKRAPISSGAIVYNKVV